MEKQSFIIGELEEQDKLPPRRVYHLTEQGRQRFETWLKSPTGCSVRAIRVEFVTRLSFAQARSKTLAQSLIDDQIDIVRAGVTRLESELDETPEDQRFNRLGLDLRLRQLRSLLGWLKACPAQLKIDLTIKEKD